MKIISYKGNELYWKRIQFISFILAVFIIIRHNSSIYNYDAPRILSIYEGFKWSITEIAVPLFFIISGFNFFNNFTLSDNKRKFKNRIKSLLIPYYIWNCLFCLFCIITSLDFFSRFFIGREKFVVSPLNILLGCVFHMECNSQFWFVFTLMVCVLMNPIIYYIIKNRISGVVFLITLFVAVMIFGLKLPEYFFYRTDAFVYYYIGAFLGLHYNKLFVKDKSTQSKTGSFLIRFWYSDIGSIVVGAILMLTTLMLLIPNIHSGIRSIIIIIGSYGFWKISVICSFFNMRWLPQGGTTFLMYAAHGIIQPITVKTIYLVLPKYSWISTINFVLAISLTVLICIGLRWFTKRYIPIVDKLITGWRR